VCSPAAFVIGEDVYINEGLYTIADEEMIKMANGSARMTSGSVYEFIVVASGDGSDMVIASPIEGILKTAPKPVDVIRLRSRVCSIVGKSSRPRR